MRVKTPWTTNFIENIIYIAYEFSELFDECCLFSTPYDKTLNNVYS